MQQHKKNQVSLKLLGTKRGFQNLFRILITDHFK